MINLTLTSYSSLRYTWKGTTMLRLLAVSPSMHIIPSGSYLKIWAHSFQFSCSVISDFLQPLAVQHARLPYLSPTLGACSNSCPSIGDAIQPSHPLLSPYPPVFNLSQDQGLFQGVSSSHQVAKVLQFQLQHQSFQCIQDWFPLGWTGWISL